MADLQITSRPVDAHFSFYRPENDPSGRFLAQFATTEFPGFVLEGKYPLCHNAFISLVIVFFYEIILSA